MSVTGLLRPVRENILALRNPDDLDFDISERIDSFIGNSVHSKIEAILKEDPNYSLEERLVLEYPDNPDFIKTIGGKYDIYDKANQRLIDIKTTKSYKLTAGSDHSAWEEQMNCYAFMMKRCKEIEVKSLVIWAFIKDWSQAGYEKQKHHGYPPSAFAEVNIKLWDENKQHQFINDKVKKIIDVYEASKQANGMLPLCNDEDVWARFYAKSAGGTIRKVRNYTDFENQYRDKPNWRFVRVHARCDRFCSVRKFCDQAKEYRRQQGIKEIA